MLNYTPEESFERLIRCFDGMVINGNQWMPDTKYSTVFHFLNHGLQNVLCKYECTIWIIFSQLPIITCFSWPLPNKITDDFTFLNNRKKFGICRLCTPERKKGLNVISGDAYINIPYSTSSTFSTLDRKPTFKVQTASHCIRVCECRKQFGFILLARSPSISPIIYW